MKKEQILLTGMKPTNLLTLGNHLGALKQCVSLQEKYDCIISVVDLHSITVRQNPKELRESTYFLVAAYMAAGVDADAACLFVQSHVPHNAEGAWVLGCFTYMGELNRMTQYKDKSSREGKNISSGLFNYPVLMASDILLYQANLVPVGEDQKQHIELTRDLAERINNLYGQIFTVPKPFIAEIGGRVMDLQEPRSKMGKSDSTSAGAIFLSDSDSEIQKKIKRAVTDSGSEIGYDKETKPGVSNLIEIQAAITGKKIPDIVDFYSGKKYGHLKADTADIVVEEIGPIRDKIGALLKDRGHLDRVFKKGAEKARERAGMTLAKLFDVVGFVKGFTV